MKNATNKLTLLSFIFLFCLISFSDTFAQEMKPDEKITDDTSLNPMTTIKTIPKNSFYIENIVILPSVNFDRIIPLSDKTGIILKAGLTYYDNITLISEALFITGKNNHFFEAGSGYDFGVMIVGLYGQFGYRYIGKKRAAV